MNDVRIDGDAEVGELLIRGPNVVAGYWGDPVRTAETFVDGWLHTGDVARIDDGIVRIVDRAKDMINRGGENVYCVEVENALAAHPDVIEVAVVGVPDPVMGEKVGAVVLPRPGVTAEDLVPVADRLRPRAAGRLQGAAVRAGARRAAAAQRRRQGAEGAAARRRRLDRRPR